MGHGALSSRSALLEAAQLPDARDPAVSEVCGPSKTGRRVGSVDGEERDRLDVCGVGRDDASLWPHADDLHMTQAAEGEPWVISHDVRAGTNTNPLVLKRPSHAGKGLNVPTHYFAGSIGTYTGTASDFTTSVSGGGMPGLMLADMLTLTPSTPASSLAWRGQTPALSTTLCGTEGYKGGVSHTVSKPHDLLVGDEPPNTVYCYAVADRALKPMKVLNSLGRGSGRFKHYCPLSYHEGDTIIPFFVPAAMMDEATKHYVVLPNAPRYCCYRIVSLDGRRWSFHNDTVYYDLEIGVVLTSDSVLEAAGDHVTVYKTASNLLVLRLTVQPGNTEELFVGNVTVFTCDFRLRVVSRAYMEASQRACEPFLRDHMCMVKELLHAKHVDSQSVRQPGNVLRDRGDRLVSRRPASAVGMSTNYRKTYQQFLWSVADVTLLMWCLQKRIPFLDVNFLPSKESILGACPEQSGTLRCGWCRPDVYLNQETNGCRSVLCPSTASPHDVSDSSLEDTAVISALAVLAESPDNIERLFSFMGVEGMPTTTAMSLITCALPPHKERRHWLSKCRPEATTTREERTWRSSSEPSPSRDSFCVGASMLAINLDGWWHNVVVDHYFPVLGMRPCFAKCVTNPRELWVSLVEKAYAKAHGCYANIVGGDPLQVIQDLTGFPTTRYDHLLNGSAVTVESLFQLLVHYITLGFCTLFDTPSAAVADRALRRLSLRPGYAYMLLDVKEFLPGSQGANGQRATPIRLLRFRNPFGHTRDWTGAWSVRDVDRWSRYPRIAVTCGYETLLAPPSHRDDGALDVEDGSFWMSWEDVQRTFQGCGTCFLHRSFYEYHVQGCFQRGGTPSCAVRLDVTERTYLCAMLSQKQPRCKPLPTRQSVDLLSIGLELTRRSLPATSFGTVEGGPSSERSKADNTVQEVYLMATDDANAPTMGQVGQLSAVPHRSIIGELDPAHSPYFLIPRADDSAALAATYESTKMRRRAGGSGKTNSSEAVISVVDGLMKEIQCGEYVLTFYTSVAMHQVDNAQRDKLKSECPTPSPTDSRANVVSSQSSGTASFWSLPANLGVFANAHVFSVKHEVPVECVYQRIEPWTPVKAIARTSKRV